MGKQYNAKDLTKTLLVVAGATILVSAVVAMPGLAYAIKPFLNKEKDYYPSHIDRTLKRLQKQQLISITEVGDKIKITLTESGRKKVLAFKLEEMSLKKGKWDGWWRIVIFDIPEEKKTARNFLRSKMLDLNFYLLQKSVLVTPWECRDEIDFIKHFYEVGDHVSLVKAKTFDGEELVRNYFGLE